VHEIESYATLNSIRGRSWRDNPHGGRTISASNWTPSILRGSFWSSKSNSLRGCKDSCRCYIVREDEWDEARMDERDVYSNCIISENHYYILKNPSASYLSSFPILCNLNCNLYLYLFLCNPSLSMKNHFNQYMCFHILPLLLTSLLIDKKWEK